MLKLMSHLALCCFRILLYPVSKVLVFLLWVQSVTGKVNFRLVETGEKPVFPKPGALGGGKSSGC